jgi:uncharacterized membrane protein
MPHMIDLTLADAYLRFAGRLHPVLVHFPIALLIAAAIFEVLRLVRRKSEVSPSARSCVVVAAIGACAAAFAGWMNAEHEGHSAATAGLIFWHRWLGVGVAGLALLLAIMGICTAWVKHPTLQRVFAVMLLAGAAAVSFTAHLGGRLTYGDNYFWEVFEAAPTPAPTGDDREPALVIERTPARPAPAGTALTVDFARDIQPILLKNCVECHGQYKQKSKLRLDHAGFLFARDPGEAVVEPGDPARSEIMLRLTMQKGVKGRMPPRGDPLPAVEVDLIRTWIAEGAYWTDPTDGPAHEATVPTPAEHSSTPSRPAPEVPVVQWTGDEATAIEALRTLGGRIEPVAEGAAELDINLSVAGAKVTDSSLAPLARLGPRVKVLNLARTPVSDAGVAALASCDKLEKLHLEGTKVSDASLSTLARLPRLSSLNVSNTMVTDAGIQSLATARVLKHLYVSDTKVTLDGAIKLQEQLPGLNIEVGIPK